MVEELINKLDSMTEKRRVVLLFSTDDESIVQEQILPKLPEQQWDIELSTFELEQSYQFDDDQLVISYLNDESLRELMLQARDQEWTIGLLPHPEMKHARYGFGIAANFEDALSDIVDNAASQLDLLLCNKQPVFNSVIVGQTFTLVPGEAMVEPFWVRIRRFGRLMRSLKEVRFTPFTITTQKEKVIETAAFGVVAVEHGRSSVLSRRFMPDSNANDGMLHALVLAPRSVFEMLRFLFASLFMRNIWSRNNPAFIGFIKSSQLKLETSKPIKYSHDEMVSEAQQLDFKVERRAIRLISGRLLALSESGGEQKEVVRTQALPLGKARNELVSYPLPWMHHAAPEEFKDLFMLMRESARATPAYLTLMVLSTLLAAFGLFANSIPVVIGAMILAPLMGPIISMSLGTLRQDESLMIDSGRSIAIGTGLSLICAMLVAWFIPLNHINSEIAARISPTLLDLGVAVVSGIAGAYAHARAEVAKSLAGVAIAVALVPPLAVAGIGLGWLDFTVFFGAFLLYLTNLVGIILAALITFMILGYSPFHRAKRGLMLTLFMVVILAIPLAFGFERMVAENNVLRQLDGQEIAGVKLVDVNVRPRDPLIISLTMVSKSAVDDAVMDEVKQEIERRLQQPVVLEIAVRVVR
ncbi:TIGR00341 family protein [Methylophaga nitratireducenticrescens]|uniref:TIGR00341 family protein n=1 Tax=Methylophaga nitratireducenticrescens TaxID=754476 RepID=UPI000CDCC844|nr:TIGR00341 family protein [Methylophaga nitratireducenticrescens]AUZ84460.1 TIGR00341 family protein [Methylophaga nitratireducenticrescens]